jgi:hypothetical protein
VLTIALEFSGTRRLFDRPSSWQRSDTSEPVEFARHAALSPLTTRAENRRGFTLTRLRISPTGIATNQPVFPEISFFSTFTTTTICIEKIKILIYLLLPIHWRLVRKNGIHRRSFVSAAELELSRTHTEQE